MRKWFARFLLFEMFCVFLTLITGFASVTYMRAPEGYHIDRAPLWDWTRFGMVNLVCLGVIVTFFAVIFISMFAFPEKTEGQQLGVKKIDKK